MSLLLVDVALALVVLFVLLSVFCSGILEWWSHRTGARARFLRKGMLRMIGDDALYRQVVNHPLVDSLGREKGGAGPSYVPPLLFADALIDAIAERAGALATGEARVDTAALGIDSLRDDLKGLDDAHFSIAATLAPILRRSGTLDQVRSEIGKWYEEQNDRVSGWYRAYARRALFVIGLLIAVAANIDFIAVTRQAARDPGLRTVLLGYAAGPELSKLASQVPAAAADAAKQAAEMLQSMRGSGLPFGWSQDDARAWRSPWSSRRTRLLQVLGWLLTAIGVSLGAPFWFDLLNKLGSLRGSGPKPAAVEALRNR